MAPKRKCALSYADAAERMAREQHDGHLTIARFGDGWKAGFGTRDLYGADRGPFWDLPAAESIEDACRDLIERTSFGGWST